MSDDMARRALREAEAFEAGYRAALAAALGEDEDDE